MAPPKMMLFLVEMQVFGEGRIYRMVAITNLRVSIKFDDGRAVWECE